MFCILKPHLSRKLIACALLLLGLSACGGGGEGSGAVLGHTAANIEVAGPAQSAPAL